MRSELEAAREEWSLAEKAAKEHDKRQAQVIADLTEQVGANTPSQPPGSQPPLELQNGDVHRLTPKCCVVQVSRLREEVRAAEERAQAAEDGATGLEQERDCLRQR